MNSGSGNKTWSLIMTTEYGSYICVWPLDTDFSMCGLNTFAFGAIILDPLLC